MRLADLHIHTYYSDSTASPQEVVDEALKAGLAAIAISDHDIIDGVLPTQEAARGKDLEIIPGIELSAEYEGKDIHMLGYFIDVHKGPLVEKCQIFLNARVERMKQMIMNLRAVGITNIDFDEVAALTKAKAVGRAHLSFLMVQKGIVKNAKEAFEKYLSEGCPGYAPKYKQSPFEAIDLIHQSGGLAVMAHPMLTQKDELIAPMAKAGLDGLEIYYPNCSDAVHNFYYGLAKKNKLLMTGGSDAHGKAKPYTYIGKATIDYALVEKMKERVAERSINA